MNAATPSRIWLRAGDAASLVSTKSATRICAGGGDGVTGGAAATDDAVNNAKTVKAARRIEPPELVSRIMARCAPRRNGKSRLYRVCW
jgi:hypothetical protein